MTSEDRAKRLPRRRASPQGSREVIGFRTLGIILIVIGGLLGLLGAIGLMMH